MPTFSLAQRHAREREREHSARVRVRLALETGSVDRHPNDARGALPGDPAALRGLPMLCVKGGYSGAIRGTVPGQSLK